MVVEKTKLINVLYSNSKIKLYKWECKIIVDEIFKTLAKEYKKGNAIHLYKIGTIFPKTNKRTIIVKKSKNIEHRILTFKKGGE